MMQQMVNQMLKSNPLFQRAQQMAQGKSEEELKQIASNLCKQRGINIDEAYAQFEQQFSGMDIDDSVLTKFVRSAMKQYKEWEEETKKFYEAACCVFYEKGWLIDYNLMMCYLEDVQHELKKIYRMCEELNGTGYDVLYIVEIQKKIHEEYKEKMKKLKVQK